MKPIIFLTLIIFLSAAIFFISIFSLQLRPAQPLNTNQLQFSINKGDGFQIIADNLEKAGLIRSSSSFKVYLLMRSWANKLKPGTYKIALNQSSREIAQMLFDGPYKDVAITIPEGWTVSMINNKLRSEGVLVGEDVITNFSVKDFLDKNSDYYFDFLEKVPKAQSLEGFLFPDTYRFKPSSDPKDVVAKFLENFKQKFSSELTNQMKKRKLNFYDVVKMASMIEAEVPHSADRAIVSGILWKRLAGSMPLQVDATIIYQKCEIDKLFNSRNLSGINCRQLSKEDFKKISPYNTYLKTGFPTGPISNPGLSALQAALFPKDSPYWFYLSDPKTGNTIFSRTLEEHNEAKAKYLN